MALGDTPEGRVVRGYQTATRRPDHLSLNGQAKRASRATAADDPWEAAREAGLMTSNLLGHHAADLLRDIFGNPFWPPVADRAWLAPTVVMTAQRIYDSRAFDSMPELGNILHRAGCANRDVLDHCRSPAPHVRGCWVVDLISGRA
jgi:hypothetical protein